MFLQAEPKYRFGPGRVKLIMAGSVRNEGDEERVMKLRTLARDLGIQVHGFLFIDQTLMCADLGDLYAESTPWNSQ